MIPVDDLKGIRLLLLNLTIALTWLERRDCPTFWLERRDCPSKCEV